MVQRYVYTTKRMIYIYIYIIFLLSIRALSIYLSIYLFVRYTFLQFASDRYETTHVYVFDQGGANVNTIFFEFQNVSNKGAKH
jgi:hypothetical protein